MVKDPSQTLALNHNGGGEAEKAVKEKKLRAPSAWGEQIVCHVQNYTH